MHVKVGICGYRKGLDVDVIETQQTFYDIVTESTASRWREGYSGEFTVKALQVITHEKSSPTYKRMKKFFGNPENYGGFRINRDTERGLEYTLSAAKVLNATIIVFQTPPSFLPTETHVKSVIDFSSILDKRFLYAWEVRGSWDDQTIRKVLSSTGFIHAVDPFKRTSLSEFKYYRLHGIGKEINYRYRYTEEDFRALVNALGDKENYVLFNNVHMIRNSLEFKNYLSGDAK
ncbi:hypothetical protein HS7_12580 [Sulfolobales archaeon HS-7]|nr:hypothetical protein HS7_12580 [Sulfolobales archaeon HS-7]